MHILFEDNHLLIVEKPINMPVCLDESQDEDLLTALKQYLKEKYNKPGNVYLGLVHRLDRPVGGVMVFAKTSKAASRLAKSMNDNKFQKCYLATVLGQTKVKDHLQDYLLKDSKTNIVSISDKQHGKLCILDYETLDHQENYSLVKVSLQTGRSHQIRVQMSHAGFPLYGDQKYNKQAKVGQQIALFAYKLSFPHPITNELVTFTTLPKKKEPWGLFEIERLVNNE